MTSLLEVAEVGIDFGGLRALDCVSFSAAPGEILAVIGPNGAGKTTLFNVISGLYRPRAGQVRIGNEVVTGLAPHQLAQRGLTRTFQNLQIFRSMSAIENVLVGRHLRERHGILAHALALPSVRREQQESRSLAMESLRAVGLENLADRAAASLSYGALKRLEIARALAAGPKVLLLDEPAAGCNPSETEEISAIICKIAATGVTIVLVEHDMRMVMKISDHIVVLNFGRQIASGSAEEVRSDTAVIEAYLGQAA